MQRELALDGMRTNLRHYVCTAIGNSRPRALDRSTKLPPEH